MAQIRSADDVKVYKIQKFLGLNESPDGDTQLKMGEASEMRNWKITSQNHLRVRPGYKTVEKFDGPVRGMWSGFVGGEQKTVCAAGGGVWDLTESPARRIGDIWDDMTTFFGFGNKLYILNGHEYLVWDGEGFVDTVDGYVPLVTTAIAPGGGGTTVENANRLTGRRRVRFSADGKATEFQLPESGVLYVDRVLFGTEEAYTGWTADTEKGTVTFDTPPEAGNSNVEVWYAIANTRRFEVEAMRFSEQFNGAADTRVFLYGDGSNGLIYSGLDTNGLPTAEYFPDLNELRAGEANTPVTGAIRQYSRLIVFKTDSTYSVSYSSMTLVDGTVTAGFYILPVNRNIGNDAPGQVQLIANYPRTLHGGGVYEWKNGAYGLTNDERQAKRISARIENSLSGFDAANCITFDNEFKQDYYIVHNGTAVIHNYAEDAWFIYTAFPAVAFTMIGNELYMATETGGFAHVSREYMSDDGAAIDAFWRSGSMSFNREWQRKVSTMIFVTIKPESAGRITVTARSDRKAEYARKVIAASLATFGKVNFARFSFNTNRRPQVERAKIKVKNFALYQLVFESNSASERSTVETVDFRLRYSGYVK